MGGVHGPVSGLEGQKEHGRDLAGDGALAKQSSIQSQTLNPTEN